MKIEEVKTFLDYVKKKGIVAQSTSNNWNGAVSAVNEVLDAEEQTVEFVLNNADVIRNRLQNQSTDMSGNTINLYVQRCQHALRNFTEWKADRADWEKKQASKPKSETTKIKKEVTPESTKGQNTNSSFAGKRMLPIPAANGETFDVALPSSYKMVDLARVIWALAVYAEDFDPATVLHRYGKPPTNPDHQHSSAPINNTQLMS